MPSKTDWIRLAPLCSDVYVYQADFLCEDCAEKLIQEFEKQGIEDTGDTNDFPQGPYPDGGGEADSPNHCGAGAGCVNAIEVPKGSKIGCPLGNPLTRDGMEYVSKGMAHDLVCENNPHSHGVQLLWSHIYPEVLRDCPLTMFPVDRPTSLPLRRSLIAILARLKKKEQSVILPEIFTDCSYVYGGATSGSKTTLWRLAVDNETGKFSNMETAYLPASEARERTLQDMIEEAISEGAWG
jgi:hypothetical protein